MKKSYYALGHVPDELKTPELCLAAVQTRGEVLECVPQKLRTPELCLVFEFAVFATHSQFLSHLYFFH